MKQTAIIYSRRSQDREDRQVNSLETQLNNSFNTLEKYDLELIWEPIVESMSAKIEFKRAWFERMIKQCQKWWVDYIIVDEPKRLSRNNIDNSRIIDLMDKKQIKWVFTTSREYLTEHPRDKFFLQFDLSLSKMDNEERGVDVRKKMITALHRWQWLSQSIFWYKNVWPKGKKDVEIVEKEAELVLKAFIMRSQNKTLQEIANFLTQRNGTKWNAERVSKMLVNTKYYWLQKFWWEEALLDSPWYRPIISKDLFDKVNWITRAVEYKKNDELPRYFTNILKDTQWNNLYPYKTKWNIYYHHWAKSSYKVNISQKSIFKEFEKHIENYNFPKPFIALSKVTLKEYYKDKVLNRETDLRNTTKELNQTEQRLSSLLEKFLDNEIDKKTYDLKKDTLESKKIELEEKYKALKQWDDNIIKIIEDLCELVENLSETYKNWNDEKKWKIIRAMQCELIISNKKELTIKESKLFEIIKSLNFHNWYSSDRQMRTLSWLYEYISKSQKNAESIVWWLREALI